MADEKDIVPAEEAGLPAVDSHALKAESLDLINQIIAATDPKLTKDLTYLFNVNQNKKTMVRQNKLNDLLDIITDQAIRRFSEHPEEIANQELFTGLKTVQEMIEKSQKQVTGAADAPLIQINQQNNEVNVGEGAQLPRAARERVKAFVLQALKTAGAVPEDGSTIEAEVEAEEEKTDD